MYIITGATGHIGNNVTRFLVNKNQKVRVLVRKIDDSINDLPIDIKVGNIFDEDFLNEHILENDIVIHCAGYIDLLNKEKMQSFRTNYQGTKKIADLCLRKKNRFIYISSVDVIPKSKRGLVYEPISLTPKKMKTYYATSKAMATDYVLNQISNGLNALVLYPSAVIGVHDYKPSAAGKEILSVLNHKILFSLNGGYNFIDVKDVAKAIFIAANSSYRGHMILSGEDQTIKSLYRSIEKATTVPKLIIPLPTIIVRLAVFFSPKYSQMMITKIKENYHYSNQEMKKHLIPELTPFDQTIKESIEWLVKYYL
ncbi:NAD-dependent epimerase/dehydratase family protein [Peloplasma aerotolerans]|uniref:NAD-dependent epimerase/dehydratase family protein n=1 Tax=Peloplasma aerotolerans TaxID=3044389 RepID=A0AAW6U2Q6_9MOLU|nr:NAD-dependent epimerase/dehydratase family protein [Mariniplasma sp. M4Ah]MDI6452175.1 NAD-dependent epimerase/dehydratase family protein [Mariniplasma sp. M4Ah]